MSRHNGADPRVYLAEPDAALRRSLGEVLVGLPVEVETFASGEALLEQLEGRDTLCVISEVALPGMSGLELLERIQGSYPGAVSFIFLSSRSDVGTAVRALKAGALDFLEKPVVARQLRRLVCQALGVGEAARR